MKLNNLYVGVIFLIIGLMVAPAMAGSVNVTGSFNVSREVLGTAKNISIATPMIKLGNTLPNGALVNLYISGAANFQPTQTYYLCANNTAGTNNVIGSGATSTNSLAIITDKITNVSANLIAGNYIWLSSNEACVVGALNTSLNVPAQSAVGSTTLSGNSAYYGSQLDTFSSNTIVKVANQISTSLSTADLIQIDYLGGAANGSTVVQVFGATNLIAMSANKLAVTDSASNMHYGIQNVTGAALNLVSTISDSQGWTGIASAYLTNGLCASVSPVSNTAVNAPASGSNMTINYANIVTATSSTSSSAINVTLCVNVAGNVVLPSRTLTGSYAYVGTTGLLAPAGGSATSWQTWIPNGYQAFNPYMYVGIASSHADDVFVRLYNNSIYTAHVYVDVYPADGSASQRFSLTDIGPNSAGLYWAADIGALANLPAGTSYAAQFTVTAPKDQVNGVSFMKRAAGERQMPLYKAVNGASNYQQE